MAGFLFSKLQPAAVGLNAQECVMRRTVGMLPPHFPGCAGWCFTSLLLCSMLSLMFQKPRQLETEAQVYDAAIKILMRRAHSVHEMKKALARRCEDDKIVKGVVERLKRENLLDDARYAKQFTRLRTESRKQGEFRIARDLRARGIPDRHIETAIKDSVASGADPAAIIRQRIERKLRLYRGEIDERKMASLYRSLIGAGFPSDLIRKELHRIAHEEIPDVEPADESA